MTDYFTEDDLTKVTKQTKRVKAVYYIVLGVYIALSLALLLYYISLRMANKESEKYRVFHDFLADFGSAVDLLFRIERRKAVTHCSCLNRADGPVRRRRAVEPRPHGNAVGIERVGECLGLNILRKQ